MRTERYPVSYDYSARFPRLHRWAGFEGGVVLVTDAGSPCHVVLDEGTLAELMDEGDEVIAIHTFESAAEREAWMRLHLPRPSRRGRG